jgi:flagellar biosynthetic protein FliR
MMNYLAALLGEWDQFLILLARFTGITFIPIFNTRNIPVQWRISILMILTFFAWFIGLGKTVPTELKLPVYVLTIATEVLTGIALALVIQFIFAGVQLAGQLLDTQMGFGIMNVVDPLSGTQAPILGNFKYVLALLVFLQVEGHHYFIKALFDSYETIPVGQSFFLSTHFIQSYLSYFGDIFIIGCKLSMPIVGTLLITDFVMGIMARTVPQMNIFMVGMPVKILIGFFVLLITIPLYIYLLNTSFADTINKIYNLLRL